MRANPSPAECARLGRLAEELGFDVVSVFGDLGDPPPIPALLAIAAATRVVSLGPACLNPYTMHPVEIAGAMAELDLASSGRAYLGLTRGAWLKTIGVAQPKPVRTLREAAAVVRLLMSGDAGGFRGEVFGVAPGFTLSYPPPRRSLPLLIGAWGKETVKMAGEIANELKVGGSANPDIVPVMRERLEAGAAERGVPPTLPASSWAQSLWSIGMETRRAGVLGPPLRGISRWSQISIRLRACRWDCWTRFARGSQTETLRAPARPSRTTCWIASVLPARLNKSCVKFAK